jgi:hypothetical protein
MTIKRVETAKELQRLAKAWAMTWEGLREEDFETAMRHRCKKGTDGVGYLISGAKMNEICGLSGSNAYPAELNIFMIEDYKGLAISCGARWLYDVIANNARREGHMPFDID